MLNLNTKQLLSIIGAILSVLMVASAQLTDIFGAGVAKTIVSMSGLGNLIIQSVMTALTSQTNTVKDVAAMPGVEKITVNSQANQTLAQVAVDPHVNKIAPTPQAMDAVEATAKGQV